MAASSKKRSGPFVVAYGDEGFLLNRMIERGRAWKAREVVLLDGDGMTDDEFIGVCEQRSFDGGDRVVILDNANKLKGNKALKAYIEAKDPKDDSVIIVAVVRSDKLGAVWKKATEKGSVRACPVFKPWEKDKLKKAIVTEAERLNLILGSGVADAFIYFLGTDLGLIVNELGKLVYLVGEDGIVQRKHVPLVVAPAMPAQPFEVAEAAVAKNPRKAMNLISLLYKSKGDGVCVPITAALLKLVERIIVARQMLDKGDDISIIATRFDMHRFRAEKHLLPLARRHKVSELLEQMKHLCRLDAHVKGPAQSKRTLVELAVLSIAS